MAKRFFNISVLVSLLLHLFVMAGLAIKNSEPPKRKDYLEVELVPSEERDPKNAEATQQKQIVEQDQIVNDEIPNDDYFLSAHNQKVLKETRADLHGAFKNDGGAGRQGSKQGQKPSIAKQANQMDEMLPSEKTPDGKPTLETLKPKFDWGQVGPNGDGKKQASQTDDFLKNVDVGQQTLLNTREFLYYTYYNRIKKQLRQYWEPKIKEKFVEAYRRGRKIASAEDRITRVVILLNRQGLLTGVQILGASGVQDLDDAAVEAFRAAAPFPNPPRGLVEADGLIRIRWDFVLEAAAAAPEPGPERKTL